MDADDLYPRRPSGRGGVALVTEQAVVWLQLLGGPPSLLTGMEFDEEGQRLTPTHAVKKGTRYRYYVPTSLITGAGGGARRGGGRRIPAGDLEGLVIARLRAFFADPGAILDAIDNETHNGSGCGELIERGRQLAEELAADATDKVRATLMALLCRVEVGSDRIDIMLSRGRFAELLAGSIDLKMQHPEATNAPATTGVH